jgi:hypothetical protein
MVTMASVAQCILGLYLTVVAGIHICLGSVIVKALVRPTKQLFEERLVSFLKCRLSVRVCGRYVRLS